MSNKLTDKPAVTTQPTHFAAIVGGAVKLLTWAGLTSLMDALYAAIGHTHAQSAVTNLVADLAAKAATNQKLDDFGSPDDNTDLNATTSAHGLLPKLSGSATDVLLGDGTFGAVPGGGGGGVALPLQAWVESSGNDGTGTVGDPSKPYKTMAAADAAGARILHLGSGLFAGISRPGDIKVSLVGHGREQTVVTEIKSHNGGSVDIQDLGVHSVKIITVDSRGENAVPGFNGGNAGTVELRNVWVSGDVLLNGGTGGDGVEGNPTPGAGGSGGNFRCYGHVVVLGSITLVSGVAGAPYNDFMTPVDGAASSAAGQVIGYSGAKLVAGQIYLGGSSGGGGVNGGNNGASASAGSIEVDELICSTLQLGCSSDDTSPGTLSARRAFVLDLSIGGSTSNSGTIDGAFIYVQSISDMGAPNMSSLVMSRINGTAIGTM